jgi:hypothetical protein
MLSMFMIHLQVLLPLMMAMLTIPVIQVVHAQNILDQINQMFGNLTLGLMGNKNMIQSTINISTTPSQNSNLVNQSITIANTSSSIPIT